MYTNGIDISVDDNIVSFYLSQEEISFSFQEKIDVIQSGVNQKILLDLFFSLSEIQLINGLILVYNQKHRLQCPTVYIYFHLQNIKNHWYFLISKRRYPEMALMSFNSSLFSQGKSQLVLNMMCSRSDSLPIIIRQLQKLSADFFEARMSKTYKAIFISSMSSIGFNVSIQQSTSSFQYLSKILSINMKKDSQTSINLIKLSLKQEFTSVSINFLNNVYLFSKRKLELTDSKIHNRPLSKYFERMLMTRCKDILMLIVSFDVMIQSMGSMISSGCSKNRGQSLVVIFSLNSSYISIRPLWIIPRNTDFYVIFDIFL